MTTRNEQATQRDVQVQNLIRSAGPEGISCADMAEQLNVPKGHVYLSVYRLKQKEQVHRVGELRTARWVETRAA